MTTEIEITSAVIQKEVKYLVPIDMHTERPSNQANSHLVASCFFIMLNIVNAGSRQLPLYWSSKVLVERDSIIESQW